MGVAISSLTVEAIGGTARDKGKNVFVLGLLAKIYGLNLEKLQRLIEERFKGKSEGIVNNALTAFHAGYAYSVDHLIATFSFEGQRE